MSTPARLVELRCSCGASHWVIDHDYRGTSGDDAPYDARTYRCPSCGFSGAGFAVIQKSPPAFFLQSHAMYPMNQAEFDQWVAVVREHFPDLPRLKQLGQQWRPTVPSAIPSESPQARGWSREQWWKFWKW